MHFQYLIDILAQKILSWNSLLLSQPTKVIQISTMLVAMISHFLPTFKIPARVTSKLGLYDFIIFMVFEG